jgi:hypothetical protein
MISMLYHRLVKTLETRRLPARAREAMRADRLALADDPGIESAVAAAVGWLTRAQDSSASADGGVARHYSVVDGWAPSYPETTGYIVPTLLDYARRTANPALRDRARRMLDWLVRIQFPEGGFQGGVIGATPRVPVTFNTGQILLGLADGTREFGDRYREAMRRAASWLARTQDADGCWRQHRTPFASPSDKAYETHVSWGLLEAARVDASEEFASAAERNVRWALTNQHDNGWFENNCLTEPHHPLTHTIGYALRGVVEAYRHFGDEEFLAASIRTADGILGALREDGFLPGRLDRQWRGTVRWACLTGTVQIAHCWLLLYQHTGSVRYRDAAFAANAFVRRTVAVDADPSVQGAVRGSWPIDGDYGRFEYLNWAAKFFIDANLLEQDVRTSVPAR